MKVSAVNAIKSSVICLITAAYCLVLSLPLASRALAQEAAPPEPEPVCVAPDTARRPTGSAAHTYTYDCTINAWQNAYYTWDSAAGTAIPKYTPEHRFNAELNRWEVYEWVYHAPRGAYAYEITSTYAPVVQPAPPAENTPQDNPSDNNNTTTPSVPSGADQTDSNDSIAPTTSGSALLPTVSGQTHNSILPGQNGGTTLNVDVDASLNTGLSSSAISGNAAVLQNTVAGSAASGDATAMATVMNMLQSNFGWQGLLPEIYTSTIQGDYYGDILIDPTLFGGTGSQDCACGELSVNASVDGNINNTVDLLAQSGDATVSANTKAGDATTGDATAVANIINMINSSITAGQSFIGVLNIHGNYEGDVLMPQEVVDTLIAANVPTVDIGPCACGDALADINSDTTITNNVNATAASGSATVAGNTIAGGAASGSAETNVTVFNLTGHSVVGRDALLVFVNVSGEWIGFITNAPQGATAAALGGGLTSYNPAGGNASYDINTTAAIHNNVNVGAYSGDAEVSNNTQAGSARSGNAYAGVNIGNIAGNHFSLNGWFGLLFINIFGNWYGSFGTNTPYGNSVAAGPAPSGPQPVRPAGGMGMGSPSLTARRPAVSAVRTFAVSFNADDDGNAVLASAYEIGPAAPSQPAESAASAASASAPATNGFNPTFLIVLSVLTTGYLVITRTDLLSRFAAQD